MKNIYKKYFIHYNSYISGPFSEFYSEGCELASEASRNFFAPHWHIMAPPCRGVPKKKQSTYKHICLIQIRDGKCNLRLQICLVCVGNLYVVRFFCIPRIFSTNIFTGFGYKILFWIRIKADMKAFWNTNYKG